MGRIKFIENILKAASALIAAAMSIIKFIGIADRMALAKKKAQLMPCVFQKAA